MGRKSYFSTHRSTSMQYLCLVLLCFGFLPSSRIAYVKGFAPSITVRVATSFDFSLNAKSGTKKKRPKDNTITVNRNAYRNYEILETIVAGISLVGTEVKSIRDGKMNIRDGFCKPDRRGTCTLHNVRLLGLNQCNLLTLWCHLLS